VLITLLLVGLLLAIVALPLAGAMGFFGSRTYLVVSLNSAELRPHGGFVGAYAVVELSYGRVVSLEYGDSKDLDDVYAERVDTGEKPPLDVYPALTRAGHSPDFPTTARALAEAYWHIADVRADGVIAVDPAAAAGLIRIVGPLHVRGEAEAVTDANLVGIVLKHTQNFDDDDEDRKQFVFELGLELAGRLRALPPTRWPEVLQALSTAADERHVQLYGDDAIIQRLIHTRGWDGSYPLPTDDFLAVVDSNWRLGNKANLVTDQELDYRVAIAPDGTSIATLTITYENRGTGGLSFSTADMPFLDQAPYDADVRIYAPLGSQRLSPGDAQNLEPELGRTVFLERVEVPPESRQSLTVQYRLPDRRVDGGRIDYELFVRKQAGTSAVPFTLTVTGPEGSRVGGSDKREWSTQANLLVDRRFRVAFERVSGRG